MFWIMKITNGYILAGFRKRKKEVVHNLYNNE